MWTGRYYIAPEPEEEKEEDKQLLFISSADGDGCLASCFIMSGDGRGHDWRRRPVALAVSQYIHRRRGDNYGRITLSLGLGRSLFLSLTRSLSLPYLHANIACGVSPQIDQKGAARLIIVVIIISTLITLASLFRTTSATTTKSTQIM